MNFLQESAIRILLDNKTADIYVLQEIDSTNRFLKTLPSQPNLMICCAEGQTQGRGRFGRDWISPFGKNIYLSLRWPQYFSQTSVSGLSLMVALGLANCLRMETSLNNLVSLRQTSEENIQIKWPNDLIWQNKKLGGVLVELVGRKNVFEAIIGIGVNVYSAPSGISACCLADIVQKPWDRNALIALFVNTLEHFLKQFHTYGFSSFLSSWGQRDYLYQRFVTIQQAHGVLLGQAKGIDRYGQLIIEDKRGVLYYVSAGEASVRK